jgi:hypothetical protein
MLENSKEITFSKSSAPVNFAYTIGPSTLERVDLISDLSVILDSNISFKSHNDATIAKESAMLRFSKRFSTEFRDLHIEGSICFSFKSRLEYACRVWQPSY